MPFMYCDPPSPIAHIRPATGPAHYQHGLITLKSGATVEISVAKDDTFLTKLRPAHHLQICYAPPQQWADEPPEAHGDRRRRRNRRVLLRRRGAGATALSAPFARRTASPSAAGSWSATRPYARR